MAYSKEVKQAVVNDVLSGMTRYAASKKWGLSRLVITKWCKQQDIDFSYHVTNTVLQGATKHIVAIGA